MVAADADGYGGGLGHVDVEVGAVVEALVLVGAVVGQIERLEQTALGVEAGRQEVAHRLRAARDVQVVLGLERGLLEAVVNPVDVREAYRVRVVLEFLNHFGAEHQLVGVDVAVGINPALFAFDIIVVHVVVDVDAVVEVGIVVGAGLLDGLGRHQQRI